jgi:mono/diheme cytochrome c family protein
MRIAREEIFGPVLSVISRSAQRAVKIALLALTVALVWALLSWEKPGSLDGGTSEVSQDAPIDTDMGRHDYGLYCASCHGERGDATGPLAATLEPRPTDHTNGSYMNALSDEHLFAVIEQGGAAVGKSPQMAGWGGTLKEPQIRNLVAFIRSLADPPYPSSD